MCMKKCLISLAVILLLMSFSTTSFAASAKYFTNLDSAIVATPDGQPILVDFYTDW